MQTVTFAGGSALQKAEGVVRTYPTIWYGQVLDVGCRSRELEKALANADIQYLGLDIAPGADIVADLGDQIPLGDGSVDVVSALDVLEHTNDIHHAFSEICRVARRHIIITLPNAYELGIRLRVLRGRPISGKYGLPSARPLDRHRWFFSLSEASEFIGENAATNGWRLTDERAVIGPNRAHLRVAVERWPNVLCGTYLALLSAPQH